MARPAGVQSLIATAAIVAAFPALAMDDGRYTHSPLKFWFDNLKNARGEICCAVADGVADPNWESHDGHYRVLIEGDWIDVPDEVVLKVPNLFGRIFLPGSMG